MHNKIPELPEFSPHSDWRVFETGPGGFVTERLSVGTEFLIERCRSDHNRYVITVKGVDDRHQPFDGISLILFTDFGTKKNCFPHWGSASDIFARALISEAKVFESDYRLCVTVEYGIVDRVVTVGLVQEVCVNTGNDAEANRVTYESVSDGSAHGNNY